MPWWDPPGHCFPTGYVQADVSTERAVAIANGSTYAELREGTLRAHLTPMGLAEGEPGVVVIAQVPPSAALVRATFPAGGTDEMAPVDGIAVLYGRAPDGVEYELLWQTDVPVEALDANGAVIASGETFDETQYVPGPECDVPPAPLPEPGEQPSDPDAARAAITDAFSIIYDTSRTDEERDAVIDDMRGLAEVRDRLASGPFAQQVNDATAETREIVFVSPTLAAVRYDIVIENYSTFADRLGEAVLVDGLWKVTRETICQDITLAAESCPPV